MPAPTLTSISPNVGGTVGGTAVTLTGTNFTGTTGVTIGGVACTSVVVVSATSITCVTPAGSTGDASVIVTNADGSNSSNSLWVYLPIEPTDVFIYLKGGRGDGFVPKWTGLFTDETKTEKSAGFRNAAQTVINGPSGTVVYPGLLSGFGVTTVPSVGGLAGSVSHTPTGTPNDIAGNTAPRQWDRSVTWRRFISASGIEFPYRLDLIDGISTKARS